MQSSHSSDHTPEELSQERKDNICINKARITLTAHTQDEHSFYFEPITFELINHGPRMIFCRKDRITFEPTTVNVNKIGFSTLAVTRGSHASIWLEDERIFIQDMGSSGGTWVNHTRLEPVPNTNISRRLQLNNNDMIILGQGDTDPILQHLKRVITRISISAFHCRSNCHCHWRSLFDHLGICRLDRAIGGPRQIYESIKSWTKRIHSPEISQRLESLGPREGELLMEIIEKIIKFLSQPYENSPETLKPDEISTCQSWIRKISRISGVFPRSFVLHGVKKVNDDAVDSGGFSDIYMGTYKDNSVALKVIRIAGTAGTSRQEHKVFSYEALLWKHLDHPHILPFMGICCDQFPRRIVLVSPWMKNGDILHYLEMNPNQSRLSLLLQSAHGLKYLHDLDPALVHGDIKASNILIDDEGNVRLSDFGLVTISGTQNFDTTSRGNEQQGTIRWMAPELFERNDKKSRASDIYAFGMTIIEVYTGKPPFYGMGYNSDYSVMMAVSTGSSHPRPDNSTLLCEIPDELWKLVESCQNKKPGCRPNAQRVADELFPLYTRRRGGRVNNH